MKVFVGLSGGVDSAVAAKLLIDQGHDVTGVFIKIWQPEFLECTWEEDRISAKRVAASLGIRFLEVDFSDEYKKMVVEDMVSAYQKGITPNPDVLCNQHIKFGSFLKWAKSHGAEKIATGHYARLRLIASDARAGAQSDIIQVYPYMDTPSQHYELHRGKDPKKDQSYFLYRLTQEDLQYTLFPVGDYTKKEIRNIAQKSGLPNADRPDSQGLCFVGDVSIGNFLSRFIALEPGKVLDFAGNVIGTHEGSTKYTIGQRHSFTISSKQPQYVVNINVLQNTITVSPDIHDAYKKSVLIDDVSWVGVEAQTNIGYEAEARYHQRPFIVRLMESGLVTFTEPQLVSPGQSLVFYDGNKCLGGGIICE
jgi:tRNA-uridine 2-sulfurtransferase